MNDVRKMRLFLLLKALGKIKIGEKVFRSDIGMWEERRSLFGKTFFHYSVWREDVFITKTTLLKIKGAKYTRYTPLPEVRIGVQEMKERHGHRWLVPTNIVYDPSMP